VYYSGLFYFVLALLLLLLLSYRNKRQRKKTALLAEDVLQAIHLTSSLDTTYLQLTDISVETWNKVIALLKAKKELESFTIHKVYKIDSNRYLFVMHHQSNTISLSPLNLPGGMPNFGLSKQELNINFLIGYEENKMLVTCKSVLYNDLDEKLHLSEFSIAIRKAFDSVRI